MSQNHFINVLTAEGGNDDARLQSAIDLSESEPGPWVLWFSRLATLYLDWDFPATLTLAFAPGVYLIVSGRFVVRGPLDAGLAPRFLLAGHGVVELLGPLDQIVANWWYQSLGRSPVELALQALWTRYSHAQAHRNSGVLPAPIRLDGPYALGRTLRIVPPPELIGRVDVVLRGQHGRPSDPPTFVLGPGAGPLVSLMSVENGAVLTVDHVAIDLGPSAAAGQDAPASGVDACLSLEGEYGGTSIEACTFRFDRDAVLVKPRLHYWLERVTAGGLTTEGAALLAFGDAISRSVSPSARLSISRCLFTGTSTLARGVATDLGYPAALNVRDCQFVGRYANAISALGGEVDVVGCQFGSDAQTPNSFNDAAADIALPAWDTHYYLIAERGLDNVDHVRVGSSNPSPRNVRRNQPLSNAHLTVTHCTSTSRRFLVMNQSFPYADSIRGGAVLTNVRHSGNPHIATSISVGPGAPRRGLILQGCRLDGSVFLFDDSLNDTVVDFGTKFPGLSGFLQVHRSPVVTSLDSPR